MFLEECSLSLVITRGSNGYNWISSIWSLLKYSKAIKKPIDRLPEILQLFIHSQATGRCLVFLLALGRLCGILARQYTRVIENLDGLLELGVKLMPA